VRRFIALLFLTLMTLFAVVPSIDAASYLWHPSYADDRDLLHYGEIRTVKIQSKVNINIATYDDLITLPGANGRIALSIIGGRPYKSLHDLNKLNDTLSPNQVLLLQRNWRGYLIF
jgi:radical SAM superfamily enzyme with C-terminal helix-hairpin-helix motif